MVPAPVEPTFDTAQEALAYRSPRNVPLDRDTRPLKHRQIQGGSWTDDRFELYLAPSTVLRFDLDGVKVRWAVAPRVEPIVPMSVQDREPVTLELKSGLKQKPRRVLWDRDAAFRKCLGRRFQKVFAGAACLWLYVEGKSSLLYFSRLVRGAGEKDLLYWTEEK
jgi:hypothetical protein